MMVKKHYFSVFHEIYTDFRLNVGSVIVRMLAMTGMINFLMKKHFHDKNQL